MSLGFRRLAWRMSSSGVILSGSVTSRIAFSCVLVRICVVDYSIIGINGIRINRLLLRLGPHLPPSRAVSHLAPRGCHAERARGCDGGVTQGRDAA